MWNNELLKEILELDNNLQRMLRSAWPESWFQANLPVGSIRALLLLEAGNVRTPGSLAESLGVGRTTVSGILDRLEAAGLLTRSIDPADKRSFLLQLTAQGRELVRQLEDMRKNQLARALETMEPAVLQALHSGLAGLVAAMQHEKVIR